MLILDEPTRGIDVGAKYEIYTIINRMVAAGKAVVVISSELPELLGTCDRIYTIAYGRITGELPVAEATQHALMELMTLERNAELPARNGDNLEASRARGGAEKPSDLDMKGLNR